MQPQRMDRNAAKRLKRDFYFAAQAERCCLCGQIMRMDVRGNHPDFASWDHVLPLSRKERGARHIVLLAHTRCNHARGNLPHPRDAQNRLRAEVIARAWSEYARRTLGDAPPAAEAAEAGEKASTTLVLWPRPERAHPPA